MKRQFRRSFEVISVLGFPHFSPLTLQSQSLYLAVSFILWCVSMQIVRWFDADCSDFQHDFMLCFLWSFVTFWQSVLCNSLKIGDGLAWGYLAFQIFKAYNRICKQLWEFAIYTFIYVFMQNRCMCIVSVSIRKQGVLSWCSLLCPQEKALHLWEMQRFICLFLWLILP